MAKTISVSEFRSRYPNFTVESYPDAAVSIRLKLAEKFFEGWDEDVWEHVVCLYVAHYLSSHGSSSSATAMGIVSGKSVDGASVSYDTGTTAEQGAGFWNATTYGRELYQLMRIFGAGAVQI